MTTDVGLYLHIPFCKQRCNYCDFCSSVLSDHGDVDAYIEKLILEAEEYKGRNIGVDTVYIGGGTPSLLSPSAFERLLIGLCDVFSFDRVSEFSMEANPGTLTKEKLSAYKSFGVNRISIGLQSVNENELVKLGRIHGYGDFLEAYRLARQVGFENVSVDLMYGIPEQTAESFKHSLNSVIALGVEHISVYGLILEPGTRFYSERHKLKLPDEDEELKMYELCCRELSLKDYGHYEISNYSKSGLECRHNLKYWRNEEYIGLGMSAYSYFDGKRYGNSREVKEYFSSERAKYRQVDIVDLQTESFEYAMMRLRLKEGISLREYERKFSRSFLDGNRDILKKYCDMGLVLLSEDRLSLTERGFYLSNYIMSDIL